MFDFQCHDVQPESVKIAYHDHDAHRQFTVCTITWHTDTDEGGVTLYLPYKARILTDTGSPVA
jgi:hypothetical protein